MRLAVLAWVWVMMACEAESGNIHEMYTSVAHVEELFVFDKLLGDLLLHLPEHIPESTRYLESYRSVAVDRSLAGGEVVTAILTGNPLHVYSVIKRLYLYWPAISTILHQYLTSDLRGKVLEVLVAQNKTTLPSQEDLTGAAMSLARLQRTYHLPIKTLMQGHIDHVSCSIKLTLQDCMIIANASHHFNKLSDAWLWYEYCCTLATNDSYLKVKAQEMRDTVALQHDKEWNADDYHFFPHPLSMSTNQKSKNDPFNKLCRSEQLLVGDNRIRCHVHHRDAPYLLLQPVRYEQLHYQPEIYVFYDVLRDTEIEIIKDLSMAQLQRSGVLSANMYMEHRISETAWIYNHSHPALLNIARRVNYITGLLVFEGEPENMAGEPLQVTRYGTGGHFSCHSDALFKIYPEGEWHNSFASPMDFPPGERMATWMFYLSDVEAGGSTGFKYAGISVAPKKGAAVFWYNLKKNGNLDTQADHGGCPVLFGQKWVANKWIRENANFLRRPCSTDPEE